MAKIITQNKQYTGISAGVTFVNGVGESDDPYLLSWFSSKGYTIENVKEEPKTEKSEQQKENLSSKEKKDKGRR